MKGLYIHIPFCKSRCIYCGFYSTTLEGQKDSYVDALIGELKLRENELKFPQEEINALSQCNTSLSDASSSPVWSTIYLGGGTPSRLNESQLQRLFNAIDYSNAEEITVECNPDDITPEYAEMLGRLPVNRISMGAQTFSDDRLRFIRRRHTAQQVATAVNLLRKAGINNISIDLIYGFPGETMDDWKSDIDHLLALHPEHISAYSLMYEEGTTLYNMLEREEIEELDEEKTREMYEYLMERLAAAGYEHYEISNFALPSYRARHNSNYWNNTPYVGIGAAAHSYNGTERSWNTENIEAYIEAINNSHRPCESEQLSSETLYNDFVMLSLRTCEGINLTTLEERFGSQALDYCLTAAQRFIADGLMTIDTHLRLTRRGIFVSDMIISELFRV